MRERWAQRCSATSKRTGRQCGQWACLGGFVCGWHGGKAPNTLAAAGRRWNRELRLRRIEREYEQEHGEPMPQMAAAFIRYGLGDMATWRRHVRTRDLTAAG